MTAMLASPRVPAAAVPTPATRASSGRAPWVPLAPLNELEELHRGLLAERPSVPPRYFYDDRGSALFEAITHTEDYYVTRTEAALMQAHLPDIARRVHALMPLRTVIEPGAGSCTKARALCTALQPERFVGLDVAEAFMAQGAQQLRQAVPGMVVHTWGRDIRRPLVLPAVVPAPGRLAFYPGTSIGNFDAPDAAHFLRGLHRLVGEGGGLLIGVDLVKPVDRLLQAYDDRDGLTAAFNRNVLLHLNRLLDADFEPEAWAHQAVWNEQHLRIEMYLQATADQRVAWRSGARSFRRGERLLTEHSHKYTVAGFTQLLADAGFELQGQWLDEALPFAVFLAMA